MRLKIRVPTSKFISNFLFLPRGILCEKFRDIPTGPKVVGFNALSFGHFLNFYC